VPVQLKAIVQLLGYASGMVSHLLMSINRKLADWWEGCTKTSVVVSRQDKDSSLSSRRAHCNLWLQDWS